MKNTRIAIILPPSILNSGGNFILNSISKILSKNFLVENTFFLPNPKKISNLKYLKIIIKILYSKLSIKSSIITKKDLKKYDFIVVGWVEDLYFLLLTGFPKNKIIHICQSYETWSNNPTICNLAYQSKVNRLFVSEWLNNSLSDYSLKTFVIGNYIRNDFIYSGIQKNSIRDNIVYQSHSGWWKNSTENLIFSSKLSEIMNLKLTQLGYGIKHGNHTYKKNIDYKKIISLLDKTIYFISLSHYEGMPLAAIEALSRGCKCILSEIPAHIELQRNFKDHVHLVKLPAFAKQVNSIPKEFLLSTNSLDLKNLKYYSFNSFSKRVNYAINKIIQ